MPEEFQEFKDIIKKKLGEARRDYDLLKSAFSNKADQRTDDASPTFKLLEEGSDVLSKKLGQLAARKKKFIENLEAALVHPE